MQALPPEDVFKEQGALAQLDLSAVRIGFAQAIELAEKYRVQTYPHHPIMKMICVLQQQELPFWNMTLVTGTLQMINIRIDAVTGQLLSRSLHSIMDLAKE